MFPGLRVEERHAQPLGPLGVIAAQLHIADPRNLRHLKRLVTPLRSQTRKVRHSLTSKVLDSFHSPDLDTAFEGSQSQAELHTGGSGSLEKKLTQAFGHSQGASEMSDIEMELTRTFGHTDLSLRYCTPR